MVRIFNNMSFLGRKLILGNSNSSPIIWNQATLPIDKGWNAIQYGNGRFVSVAGSFDSTNIIVYSSNGINWTQGVISSVKDWQGITFGGGKFVAVSWSSNIAAYSTDGINWTNQCRMEAENM